MHACFVFWIVLDPLDAIDIVFSLHGISSVFFNDLLELFIIRINKIDDSQLSRIVELRFLDSPLLLYLSLNCF